MYSRPTFPITNIRNLVNKGEYTRSTLARYGIVRPVLTGGTQQWSPLPWMVVKNWWDISEHPCREYRPVRTAREVWRHRAQISNRSDPDTIRWNQAPRNFNTVDTRITRGRQGPRNRDHIFIWLFEGCQSCIMFFAIGQSLMPNLISSNLGRAECAQLALTSAE